MSAPQPPDAIRKSITVRCGVETTFRIWTEQLHLWWPKGHNLSGNPDSTVRLECRIGGRLYERMSAGIEHEWGAVTLWEPPHRFDYDFYLGSSRDQPTSVSVRFSVAEDGGTRIDVSHRGPGRIGPIWSRNAPFYEKAWERVLPAYTDFCSRNG